MLERLYNMLEQFKWYRKMIGGLWFKIKYFDDLKCGLFFKWLRFPVHASESYRLCVRGESYPYRKKDSYIEKKVAEEIQENLRYRYLVKKCSENYHNGRLKVETKEFAKKLAVSNPSPLPLDKIMYALYYELEKKDIVFHKPDDEFKNTIYEKIYLNMTHKGLVECVGLNQYQFRS